MKMTDILICPRCNTELICTSIDDVITEYFAYQCPDCKGYWFSKQSELEQISKVSDISLFEFTHIPKLEEQIEPLNCPSCNNNPVMEKIEHKKDTRVIIDVCPQCHGVWLDAGELEAIQKESVGSIVIKLFRWLRHS